MKKKILQKAVNMTNLAVEGEEKDKKHQALEKSNGIGSLQVKKQTHLFLLFHNSNSAFW